MRFRDVVLCDNPRCGAILRISDIPGAISVPLQIDLFGAFVVCPRCEHRTIIETSDADPVPLNLSRLARPALTAKDPLTAFSEEVRRPPDGL
jgi:hypothetical protein